MIESIVVKTGRVQSYLAEHSKILAGLTEPLARLLAKPYAKLIIEELLKEGFSVASPYPREFGNLGDEVLMIYDTTKKHTAEDYRHAYDDPKSPTHDRWWRIPDKYGAYSKYGFMVDQTGPFPLREVPVGQIISLAEPNSFAVVLAPIIAFDGNVFPDVKGKLEKICKRARLDLSDESYRSYRSHPI